VYYIDFAYTLSLKNVFSTDVATIHQSHRQTHMHTWDKPNRHHGQIKTESDDKQWCPSCQWRRCVLWCLCKLHWFVSSGKSITKFTKALYDSI